MTTSLDDLLRTRVARYVDRTPDWDAFADARVEGYRRAQHRYIGSGASGKTDTRTIPAEHFTLSVMFVPPGQGNAAHSHEVEEVFFILDGKVKVFFEDVAGGRAEAVLGRRSEERRVGKEGRAGGTAGASARMTQSRRG